MIHPKYEKWPYKKVLPEHVPILIERYQLGESVEKISTDFPFGKDAILKVLRDFDIPIKTRKENRFSMGFSINENAFLDQEEPECAYFYGWLLTDGCLRETKYAHTVTIQIQKGDISVLPSLEAYLGLSRRVKTRDRFDKRTGNTYSSCNMQFQYAPITDRLMDVGLEPRKSLNEVCPKEFLLNRDFWRGVLEGDGHLPKLGGYNKIQICGSEELCRQWADYCKSIIPEIKVTVYPATKKSGKNLFYAYCGKFEECKKILDSLYLGVPENLRLERKYNLYVGRYYNGLDPNRAGEFADRQHPSKSPISDLYG